MNIEDLKEMVKNCVYEEENLVCMSSEYYQKIIKNTERLNKKLKNLEKLNNANYQSFIEVNNIINKAIDFLKENACIDEDVEYFCDDLRYDDCKKLLDILRGSDKE